MRLRVCVQLVSFLFQSQFAMCLIQFKKRERECSPSLSNSRDENLPVLISPSRHFLCAMFSLAPPCTCQRLHLQMHLPILVWFFIHQQKGHAFHLAPPPTDICVRPSSWTGFSCGYSGPDVSVS